MQVIGICRFSYPAKGGFQVAFPTIAEQIAYLYAPERMEERFRQFETLTLPSLKGQTDPDFQLAVVIGESLPQPHRDRLMALLADLPQVALIERPPGLHRTVMQDAINSLRVNDGAPSIQFRLDDDDGVARTFVARLREAAQDARAVMRKYRSVAIDFNRGYLVRPTAEGILAKPTVTPYQAAGLGIVFRPRAKLTVMNFAHAKLAQKMPTLTFTDSDMLLRGHSAHNDSRQKPSVKPEKLTLLDADGEAHLRTVFNVDADHVRSVYAPRT